MAPLVVYVLALVYCSFAEFLLHRFVMHRRTFVPFPYELHAVGHHGLFGPDETYHARDAEARGHITFVPRDYLILLAIHAPFLAAAEHLATVPFLAPAAALALLSYLVVFDVLHWGFHVPSDNWLQGTRVFRFLKEHHRIHHAHHDRNVNVVLPLADVVFGTISRSPVAAKTADDGARR